MKKFSRFYLKFVGVGVALGAITAAKAVDQIEYIGPDAPSEAVNISFSPTSMSNEATAAGFLKFQVTAGNSGISNPFEAICGDILHSISGTSTYSDTVYTAGSTPAFGGASSSYTTAASILGAGNIIGNNFDTAWTAATNQAAAGLQIAVWAEEYDFAQNATVTNLATFESMLSSAGSNHGLMTISGTAAGDSTTMADAYADWLTKGTTPGGTDTTLFLRAGTITSGPFSGAQGQDQWTEQSHYTPSGSPEPFTMGIGIAGVAFAVRRKVKRSK